MSSESPPGPGQGSPARRSGPSRPGARRAPVKDVKIPVGPPWKKILPWVLAAAAVGALVFLFRDPRYVRIGALLIGLVVMCLLGYVSTTYRANLPPDDKIRPMLPIVALLTVASAAIPYGMVLYPSAPEGTVPLAAVGESHPIDVRGVASTVILQVQGTLSSTASGTGDYFMSVTRDQGARENIDGALHPHAGGVLPETHRLGAYGPGRYTVRLEQISPALVMPLRVSLYSRPFNTVVLSMLYGLLAIVILYVDLILWRRGLEPSFAAALILPLVAVMYFQHRGLSPEIQPELRSAGIVGLLAGGLGGELVAQLLRKIAPGR